MRYRRRKVDANQGEIVKALYGIGCGVVDLSAVGGGVPDLLVGYRGQNFLLEVKDPKRIGKKPRGAAQISTDEKQQEFYAWWEGPIAVVSSIEEAIAAVSA